MAYEQYVKSKFNVFYRQQDAFDHCESKPQLRVFTFETPELGQGKRRFLCADPKQFYEFYRTFKYGQGVPCRPYFDLEFYKVLNPDLDQLECFNDFISICKNVFSQTLEIHLEDKNFMILDSTTDDKFSAHVIIHLPNKQLFPSNIALKPLINLICDEMSLSRKCIVKKTVTDEDFLCDRSVYSKNRNFRMYYSSKCGKNAKLIYADYCNFYDTRPQISQMFFDTLVVPENLSEHTIIDVEPLIKANGESDYATKLPRTMTPSPTYQYPGQSRSNDVRIVMQGYGSSQFPELDDVILNLMQPLTPGVRIRKWDLIYCEKSKDRKIVYQLSDCRFCYRIMREHRSNNVLWTINFETFACYQTCFDFECRHFRSNWQHISYQAEETAKKRADEIFASFGIESKKKNKGVYFYYEIKYNPFECIRC